MDPAFVFGGSIGGDICVSSHLFHVCFGRVKTTAPQNTREKYQLKLSKQGNRTIPRIKR